MSILNSLRLIRELQMKRAYSVKLESVLQGLGTSTKITLENEDQAYLLKSKLL